MQASVCLQTSPSSLPSRPCLALKKRATLSTKALLSAIKESVLRDFHERTTQSFQGLQNFDKENVASVITAAEQGGATHVDIACDPELVKLAIGLTSLPVCVSSVDPATFPAEVEAGPLMVHAQTNPFHTFRPRIRLSDLVPFKGMLNHLRRISQRCLPVCVRNMNLMTGNYDSFYEMGVIFTPEQGVGSAVNKLNDVVEMIAEVRSICNSLGASSGRLTKAEEKVLKL